MGLEVPSEYEGNRLQKFTESNDCDVIKEAFMDFIKFKVSGTKSFYSHINSIADNYKTCKSEYELLQLKKQIAENIKNNLGNEEIINQICRNDKDLEEKLINLKKFSLEGYDNYINDVDTDESGYIKHLVCNILFETEQNKTETFIEKVKRLSNIEDNDVLNETARQVRTFLKELFNNENVREEFIENSKRFYFSEVKVNDNFGPTTTEGNNIPDNQNDINKKIALLTYETEMWCYPNAQTDDNRIQDNDLERYTTNILNQYNCRKTVLYNILNIFEDENVGKDQISQQTKILLYQIQQKLNKIKIENQNLSLLRCRINLFFSKETYKLFYTTDICEKMQEKMQELAKSNNEKINKFIKSGYFSEEQIELLCNRMYPRIEDVYVNYSEYQKIYGFSQVNKLSSINKISNRDRFNEYMYNVFEKYHTKDITTFDNAQQQELENDLSNKFGSNCVFSYGLNDFNDFLESKYIAELTNKNKEFNRPYVQKWFYEFATNVYNNKIRLENENLKQLRKEIDTAINRMPTKEQMQLQQIDILQRQNIELQQQKEVVEKELQERIAELQSKMREMETVNNQLKTENQKLTDQNNDLLRQNQQPNRQSQDLTTEAAENVCDMEQDLPSDDIYIGNQENQQMENAVDDENITGSSDLNENQPEQMEEENNERIEDFEEQEEGNEGDEIEIKNDFMKKISRINDDSKRHNLSGKDKKTVGAALAKLEKFNNKIKEQTQKLKGYDSDAAKNYLSQLDKDDDIDEINKYFTNKDKFNDSESAQDEERNDEAINTEINACKVLSDRKFFEQLKLEDENLEKKIKDTYEEMSDMDKENKKQLNWTTEQVKVTALLLKKFYTEHGRRPDDRKDDNDFCKKMQKAVGRKIQCTSFTDHMIKHHKLLYNGFIMNGKVLSKRQPDIELNENAVKIFVDEFRKVRTAYEELTGHKDFKIPVGMIVGNIMNDPDKNRYNNFLTILPDPNDGRVHEKIFNRVKSDKFINKFETELNNKNESERICWKFFKGGVADSTLDTFVEGEGIKRIVTFKRNIICLCARRELYKFVIQYCLRKKDQIEFEKLAKKLNKKVSGQEKEFVNEIKSAVSKIFNDNTMSKSDNIQGVLNTAYVTTTRSGEKQFKQCIINDMIGKINSYMEDENQIENISERLVIAHGLKENKVLKDGENGALDYYDEELKGQLKGALNKLSNEMNKTAAKKRKDKNR